MQELAIQKQKTKVLQSNFDAFIKNKNGTYHVYIPFFYASYLPSKRSINKVLGSVEEFKMEEMEDFKINFPTFNNFIGCFA
jgi:hypothetical protein